MTSEADAIEMEDAPIEGTRASDSDNKQDDDSSSVGSATIGEETVPESKENVEPPTSTSVDSPKENVEPPSNTTVDSIPKVMPAAFHVGPRPVSSAAIPTSTDKSSKTGATQTSTDTPTPDSESITTVNVEDPTEDSTDDKPAPAKHTRKQQARKVAHEYQNYFRQSSREISRNKMQCCLGCSSIFLVVFIVAIAISTLQYSPVIFLGLAESSAGEIDLALIASTSTGNTGLNYTLISEVLAERGTSEMSYHSPRHIFNAAVFDPRLCPAYSTSNPTDVSWSYIFNSTLGQSDSYMNFCATSYTDCLNYNCEPLETARVHFVDSEREQRMGLGRSWKYPPVPRGSCYIQTNLAAALGVEKGDYILVATYFTDITSVRYHYNAAGYNFTTSTNRNKIVTIPLLIAEVIPSTTRKWRSTYRSSIMLELKDLPWLLSEYSSSNDTLITPAFRANLASLPPADAVYQVVANVPPERFDYYRSSTFATNAAKVVSFTSQLVYLVGMEQVVSEMPCLESLEDTSFQSAFLGLMLNIVIILLTLISVLLIYSLLMISVESRTFEMAIYRMVGMQRGGLIQMILVYALCFAIPGWSIGLIIAQIAFAGLASVLGDISNLEVSPLLSSTGSGVATLLGIAIPVIAAMLPIRAALGKNLHDALDNTRSKAKAVEITVERATLDRHSGVFFITGVLLTAFGFMIYYFLPLALLDGNATMLFNIFLLIIMSMLVGLVLLALNFQPLVEQAIIRIVFLVLFFENPSVPDIVRKNLQSHRLRNRKTAITYATSLAFIIFLAVAVGVQIRTLEYTAYIDIGAQMRITSFSFDATGAPRGIAPMYALEQWALNEPLVEDFSWVSYHLEDTSVLRSVRITSYGQFASAKQEIFGVTPNVYETLLEEYYNEGLENKTSPYSITEQLYTPEGDRGALMGYNLRTDLAIESLDTEFLVSVTTDTSPLERISKFSFVPMALVRSIALFQMTYFSGGSLDMTVSLPTYVELSEGQYQSVMDIPMRYMLLKLSTDATLEQLDALKRSMPTLTSGYPESARDNFSSFTSQTDTIEWIFQIVTLFALVIAFFSLNASMYTNIIEQSKEAGILRALGLTRWAIFRIYVFEALFLVLSSALLGSLIGCLIGWSIAAQSALFSQVPLSFQYPWGLVITVVIAAVVCSILSTAVPVARLVGRTVIGTLRS